MCDLDNFRHSLRLTKLSDDKNRKCVIMMNADKYIHFLYLLIALGKQCWWSLPQVLSGKGGVHPGQFARVQIDTRAVSLYSTGEYISTEDCWK